MKTFKIGTRGSLLAVTQSTLLMQELQQKTSFHFELVKIKTQGDQIVDKPLWQLDGKDFFTKELDEALLNHQVDFVIHSYKDLGSQRPAGIQLGAITKRLIAHDVLLIKKSTIENKLISSSHLKIGTSSPRRIVNLTSQLSSFLPGPSHTIECITLRGNINSRIQKLQDDQYDAIVLAAAGIERLALHPDSAIELKKLLSGLSFMFLPTLEFPPASSQGALGVEYSSTHPEAQKIAELLQKVHDPLTADVVSKERELFLKYGGGCHLAVGIHVKNLGDHYLEIHRGQHQDQPVEIKKISPHIPSTKSVQKIFLGHGNKKNTQVLHDDYFDKELIPCKLPTPSHLIITGKHAWMSLKQSASSSEIKQHALWVSGKKTWQQMSQEGFWIHGSHEGLGDRELEQFIQFRFVQMMLSEKKMIHFLSHDQSQPTFGRLLPCYQHHFKTVPANFIEQLKSVSHCFWSSFPQFEAYINVCPELLQAEHYCGPGKTYQRFKQHEIRARICLDTSDFLSQLNMKETL